MAILTSPQVGCSHCRWGVCLDIIQRMVTCWERIKQAGTVSLTVLVSCQSEDAARVAPTLHSTPGIERLRALTTKACKCKMAGRDAGAIDRELARSTARFSKEAFGTASLPLSYEITCFPELGGDACMTNAIIVSGLTSEAFVCTDAEADELDAVWNATFARGGRQSASLSNAAMLERLQEMRSDSARTISQTACNQI